MASFGHLVSRPQMTTTSPHHITARMLRVVDRSLKPERRCESKNSETEKQGVRSGRLVKVCDIREVSERKHAHQLQHHANKRQTKDARHSGSRRSFATFPSVQFQFIVRWGSLLFPFSDLWPLASRPRYKQVWSHWQWRAGGQNLLSGIKAKVSSQISAFSSTNINPYFKYHRRSNKVLHRPTSKPSEPSNFFKKHIFSTCQPLPSTQQFPPLSLSMFKLLPIQPNMIQHMSLWNTPTARAHTQEHTSKFCCTFCKAETFTVAKKSH